MDRSWGEPGVRELSKEATVMGQHRENFRLDTFLTPVPLLLCGFYTKSGNSWLVRQPSGCLAIQLTMTLFT